MKFALVNEKKLEAQPKLRGNCISCQSDMLAKCGKVKVWHWAHKSKVSCDPWWENETEWHRAWKNHFPAEWQEIVHTDSTTREKHIADIKTDKEFVIEFQHSAITSEEASSREAFYENIVWVVNGTRLPGDYKRFCKGTKDFGSGLGSKEFGTRLGVEGFSSSIWNNIFFTWFPEECFPKRWLTASVPVYFDFQGFTQPDQPDEKRSPLWVLFPGTLSGIEMVISKIERKDFIELSSTAPHLLLAHDIRSLMAQYNQRKRAKENEENEIRKWSESQSGDLLQQLLTNSRRGRYGRFK